MGLCFLYTENVRKDYHLFTNSRYDQTSTDCLKWQQCLSSHHFLMKFQYTCVRSSNLEEISMKRILIIEDEKSLVRFIQLELEHEQFYVKAAYDGSNGLQLALAEEWDMILLDIMLPHLDGVEVCRRLRNVKSTPVIMLTARDGLEDRVQGLDSGADDYIAKPFDIEELLARMRAIFRRIELQDQPNRSVLTFRDITVDLDARVATRGGTPIELTKREFDLLAVFMKHPNLVQTRDMLLDLVWGYDSQVETNVVDVYVRYLRNKLDSAGEESVIQTVRGMGYVMRT